MTIQKKLKERLSTTVMSELRCGELSVNAALQQFMFFKVIKNIAKLKNNVFIVQHKLCKVIR